jgi:hypothetical protein
MAVPALPPAKAFYRAVTLWPAFILPVGATGSPQFPGQLFGFMP